MDTVLNVVILAVLLHTAALTNVDIVDKAQDDRAFRSFAECSSPPL